MITKWLRRIWTGTLCLMIALSGTFALGEENIATAPGDGAMLEEQEALTAPTDDSVALYTARATTALKLRREPRADAFGNGSIAKGDLLYVLELGEEWSRVDIGRNIGYVMTKYLTDINDYAETGEPVAATEPQATESVAVQPSSISAEQEVAPEQIVYDTSADTPEGFQENFKAHAYRFVTARSEMDESSKGLFGVQRYQEVTVSANHGDWSYIRYNNQYGYVLSSSLFKWDRLDPFAGDIPGLVVRDAIVFVNHTTNIMSYDDNGNEIFKTVNPGSALAVDPLDNQGRYPLAYWRTNGYIKPEDVSYRMEVVPWQDAQSGDLISAMSTYYAIGISTVNYQGRNWNIYLGSSFISGTVIQPGEQINIYDVMGPYRSSTGYHRAPIMSKDSLWGYGGGTCQVNTTLYNLLIQVPIYINWRKVHADVGIYYTPVGFDAAVGGGDITMIFTNTLPYAVRINFFMSDGVLTGGIFRV